MRFAVNVYKMNEIFRSLKGWVCYLVFLNSSSSLNLKVFIVCVLVCTQEIIIFMISIAIVFDKKNRCFHTFRKIIECRVGKLKKLEKSI